MEHYDIKHFQGSNTTVRGILKLLEAYVECIFGAFGGWIEVEYGFKNLTSGILSEMLNGYIQQVTFSCSLAPVLIVFSF